MSARCAYCDAALRPNSMFCLECGQVVGTTAPPVPERLAATLPAPSAPAAGPAAAPAPAPAAVPLPTRWRAPGSRNDPARGAADPAPAGQPAAAPRSVTLTFSTGERATVAGTAVIGRQPQSSAQNSGAQAIELHDTTRSVSRVHLTLTVGPEGVDVIDPGSGNGSSIERGGVRTPLREGRPTRLSPGDRIWLGDVSADLVFG